MACRSSFVIRMSTNAKWQKVQGERFKGKNKPEEKRQKTRARAGFSCRLAQA